MMPKNCKGFTLIELVIVLGVLTILGGMIALPVSSHDVRNLKRICSEFQADVRYAQRMSVIEGKIYGVAVNELTQSYSCYYYEYGSSVKYSIKKDVVFKNGYKIELGSSSKPEIEYNPWGTLSKGSQTITLSNAKYTAEITIIPATGRISVKSIRQRIA